MKPFLILMLLASSAFAADTYTPAPLNFLIERVDEHDQQICEISERLDAIEKILIRKPREAAASETVVRIVVDQSPQASVVVGPRVAAGSKPVANLTAATVAVKSAPAATVGNRYKTLSELRSEIAGKRTSRVYATISPNTKAWAVSHLISDHGFTSAQVSGLSHDEAWMLHNLAHPNIITPTTRSGVVQRSIARVETFTPRLNIPTSNNGGCPNGRCPTARGAVQAAATWYPGKLIFGR